ncbi:MAG: serine hydrolase [Oceanicaulis sp.]|uniref:serine hydrolase domain-containing protein n=1 Tax=Oceanicaulis sp. UBA2681 TaxID=1947007 RepID=UPI000C08E561|nr:serine hydrolase [Oceanicaulis sp. UBA2681]MAP49419.1 serine hydrolase [Oceanicaulis sp.]|tara:strand:- start:4902 stop:6272 length:1371 start_codon:yes stop_codon:yes gene_type:complete
MRRLVWVIALIAALFVGGWLYVSQSTWGRIYLPSGAGLTAKQACSLTFVSGLDPERAQTDYIDPLLGPAKSLISLEVDRSARRTTSAIFGLFYRQTAVFRDGLGCTLVHDPDQFDADLTVPMPPPSALMEIDTAWRDAHFDADALDAALDAAFTEDGRNTLAALVLHDGRLVAERYADGVDARSPLLGWSMTKSAAVTFAGVLVERGLIDMRAEGLSPDLNAVDRPDITLDDMLRMTGGLDGFELNNGHDPNSEMLMTQSDMAAYAASRNKLHEPGEEWSYQSVNTILAGAAMEEFMGDTLADRVETLRAWLFEPLGMNSVVFEPDQSGTLQWSSYMYATAQDWARLGQLYLDNGRVGDAQIIPPNWLTYVGTPTVDWYGSGFWLNIEGLPSDTVAMQGFQGQHGFVIPSEDLVIVRMGATLGMESGAPEFGAAVIAAKRDTSDLEAPAEAQTAEG